MNYNISPRKNASRNAETRLKDTSGAAEVGELDSPNGLLSLAPVDVVDAAVPSDFDEGLPAADVVMVADGFGASVVDAGVIFGEEEPEDGVPPVVVDEVFVLFAADFVPKPIRA